MSIEEGQRLAASLREIAGIGRQIGELRKESGKLAGVLRKSPKLNWGKDKGKEPQRNKADFPWKRNASSANQSYLTFDVFIIPIAF